jgi:hypothetical protein
VPVTEPAPADAAPLDAREAPEVRQRRAAESRRRRAARAGKEAP